MSPQVSCLYKNLQEDLYTFSVARGDPKALYSPKTQILGVYPASVARPDIKVTLPPHTPASSEYETLSTKPCPFREPSYVSTGLCTPLHDSAYSFDQPHHRCPSGLESWVFPGVPALSGPMLTQECAHSRIHLCAAARTPRSMPATQSGMHLL